MMPGEIFCVSCGRYHMPASICPNIRLMASNATLEDRRRGPRDRRAADALREAEKLLRVALPNRAMLPDDRIRSWYDSRDAWLSALTAPRESAGEGDGHGA